MRPPTNADEIRHAFNTLVEEIGGNNIEDADDDTALVDIGVDSLDLIEIGMLIEEQLNTIMDANVFADVTTIADVINGVLDEIANNAPDRSPATPAT